MDSFWQKLPRPFFALAPMADVTDAAFRRIIAKYGKPDVMWTEFVSADGLVRAPEEGRKKLLRDLLYSEAEQPIVAQLFTSNPENMKKAAELVRELGFDGLDINMGCPDRSIEKQGAGAALIKNPKQAIAVIRAGKEGMAGLPVSVKTRIGYDADELDSWLPIILNEGVAAVTIHARTRKEMSKVPARWDTITRAVKIRDEISPEALIIGNGDAKDVTHARVLADESACDGVMLGRAIFGNPFLFANLAQERLGSQIERPELVEGQFTDAEKKLGVLVEHTKLFEELLGDIKNFSIMKKHFKAYLAGIDGAGELRIRLMETKNAKEVKNIVQEWLASSSPLLDS